MNQTKIKVYLLTGFLGTGKTTVLNRIKGLNQLKCLNAHYIDYCT